MDTSKAKRLTHQLSTTSSFRPARQPVPHCLRSLPELSKIPVSLAPVRVFRSLYLTQSRCSTSCHAIEPMKPLNLSRLKMLLSNEVSAAASTSLNSPSNVIPDQNVSGFDDSCYSVAIIETRAFESMRDINTPSSGGPIYLRLSISSLPSTSTTRRCVIPSDREEPGTRNDIFSVGGDLGSIIVSEDRKSIVGMFYSGMFGAEDIFANITFFAPADRVAHAVN